LLPLLLSSWRFFPAATSTRLFIFSSRSGHHQAESVLSLSAKKGFYLLVQPPQPAIMRL
jgi:hypothetical protein